jgi:hypothetical protein
MQTDLTKLNADADELLRLNGNDINRAAAKLALTLVENAKRPLLVALIADWLAHRPASMLSAGAPPKISLRQGKETARAPIGRRREGPHRRHKAIAVAKISTKAGAIAARKVEAHAIFKRKIRGAGPIGSIRVHELVAISEGQAATAASFLQRGFDDAVESIACHMLSKYCIAADPFALVRDVIPARVIVKTFEAATVKAAEVINAATTRVAHDVIATGQQAPPQMEEAPQ